MKSIKPKMYSICSCGYDLVYACGKCGRHFNIVDDDFNFCPTCGSKIDWGVIMTINEEWKRKYIEAIEPFFDEKGQWHSEHPEAQAMRDHIDGYNSTITDGNKYGMTQTEATRRAVIISNINYYLGNGWTKPELINRGFFTESDFALYEKEDE